MAERGVHLVSERRVVAVTAALLLVLAAVSWAGLARTTMATGMAPAPVFIASWLLMTVAMMVPATLPVLLLHRLQSARAGAGPIPTLGFLGGYLMVWAAAGAGAFAVVAAAGWMTGVLVLPPPLVAAAALLVAGVYQLSPVKGACLRACRSPLTVLFDVRPGDRLTRHVEAGAGHGLWCLACCWSLMAVLLVAGLMSIAWMAALTVVFLVEKSHPRGPAAARAVGVLLILLGLAGLVHPEVLTWLSGGMPPAASGGGM